MNDSYSTVSKETIERYEQCFRDLFSKANKSVSVVAFGIIMTVTTAFWGSLFGLIYNDMQRFKASYVEQRFELIKTLGDIQADIAKISPTSRSIPKQLPKGALDVTFIKSKR